MVNDGDLKESGVVKKKKKVEFRIFLEVDIGLSTETYTI